MEAPAGDHIERSLDDPISDLTSLSSWASEAHAERVERPLCGPHNQRPRCHSL